MQITVPNPLSLHYHEKHLYEMSLRTLLLPKGLDELGGTFCVPTVKHIHLIHSFNKH